MILSSRTVPCYPVSLLGGTPKPISCKSPVFYREPASPAGPLTTVWRHSRSCPCSSQASTFSAHPSRREDLDGRDKPGHEAIAYSAATCSAAGGSRGRTDRRVIQRLKRSR